MAAAKPAMPPPTMTILNVSKDDIVKNSGRSGCRGGIMLEVKVSGAVSQNYTYNIINQDGN
jgi:hypothetical protein